MTVVASSYLAPILGQVAAPGTTAEEGCSVHVFRTASEHIHIVVTGALATSGASALPALMRAVLTARPQRIQLDLTRLTDCSPVGVTALAACLTLARQLECGMGVTVAGPAGRRALLQSLTEH